MKVYYQKDKHVIIKFGANELKQALGVLKALAKYFKAKFLIAVAEELEQDLSPIDFHICENCFMEINVKRDSYVHVDDTYYHAICPPLREDRPV